MSASCPPIRSALVGMGPGTGHARLGPDRPPIKSGHCPPHTGKTVEMREGLTFYGPGSLRGARPVHGTTPYSTSPRLRADGHHGSRPVPPCGSPELRAARRPGDAERVDPPQAILTERRVVDVGQRLRRPALATRDRADRRGV